MHITCIAKLALLMMSNQVLSTRTCDSTTAWFKLKPFRLKGIVDTPKTVNQIPRIGKKKCNEHELLNYEY